RRPPPAAPSARGPNNPCTSRPPKLLRGLLPRPTTSAAAGNHPQELASPPPFPFPSFPCFFSLLTTPAPRVLFHRERHGLLRLVLRCLPEPAAYPAPRARGPRARARPRARLRGSSSRWPPLRQVHRHHRPIVRPPSLLLLAIVNFRRAANDSSGLYFEPRRMPSSRHTSTPARLHN
uniref:Uncharacterized protein n=1 Tax=Triticum urartu TaxID=4572 RepID=A0A8R7V5Z1_TRIUA